MVEQNVLASHGTCDLDMDTASCPEEVFSSLRWRHNGRDIPANSPCEFPAQVASNAENVSISWRHHDHQISHLDLFLLLFLLNTVGFFLFVTRRHPELI